MNRTPKIAASVLSADFARLGDEVRAVDRAGSDWIHVDVMDGRFVPDISFGPAVVQAIRRSTDKPLNVHLMVVEPERSLERYRDAGADHLLVQAEPGSTVHLHRVLGRVRELGCRPGVVLDPATPIMWIEHVLHLVDIVLVMTVNPGFGGQPFLADMLPKIAALRALCDERGLDPHIEVDGGQSPETVRRSVEAGADVIVAGSAIFGATDYASCDRIDSGTRAMSSSASGQLPVVVVMGVSASGKSTLGEALAKTLGCPFEEGDSLHPAANVEKMRNGIELDDDDRAPWLDRVAQWIGDQVAAGEGGVITCSALKHVYRDRLRAADPALAFVLLDPDEAVLKKRITERRGHFMPPSLLASQLRTLERPDASERALTLRADFDVAAACRSIEDWLREGG